MRRTRHIKQTGRHRSVLGLFIPIALLGILLEYYRLVATRQSSSASMIETFVIKQSDSNSEAKEVATKGLACPPPDKLKIGNDGNLICQRP